jgi:hypothetical protein
VLILPDVFSSNQNAIWIDMAEDACQLAFSKNGNILAVCSRTEVLLYSTTEESVSNYFTRNSPLLYQQLERRFDDITGLSFSENKLFVADCDCIVEFELLGLGSLKSLCVKEVLRVLQADPSFLSQESVPVDVANAIWPSNDEKVEFDGEEVVEEEKRNYNLVADLQEPFIIARRR